MPYSLPLSDELRAKSVLLPEWPDSSIGKEGEKLLFSAYKVVGDSCLFISWKGLLIAPAFWHVNETFGKARDCFQRLPSSFLKWKHLER